MAETRLDREDRVENDYELAQSAARGDEQACRHLVERLFSRVRRTVSYLAGGGADAEDLSQMALIQIVNSAGSFRGDCTLEYWADRVAVQTAAKCFAKNKRRAELWETHLVVPPAAHMTENEVEQLRLRQRLAELLHKLSEKHRTAVALHYLYGYKVDEIAELTSARVNTVRGRLRVGKKRLQQLAMRDTLLSEWIAGRTK
ncbi:MAG: sigma-70 family RNA polymerase sigma factor [Deltaproteobacteria bacterium]|nr:sigma-70 family RNA polymerase sigma factor [Deltaproteobacteria bacterium]